MLGKTLSAAAAFALLAAGPVNATCTEADIGGSWAAYSAGTEPPPGGAFFWLQCGFSINTAGKITAGSCANSDGMVSPVTGSIRLAVPANCVFGGAIDITTMRTNLRISHATLSLDKQTVLGVAASTVPLVGVDEFVFDMVKVK